MKGKKLFFGFCLFTFSLFAQDRLGLANSNYMPVTTNLFNPSSLVDSYTWLDINVVGASVFFHNNFLYIPGSKLAPSDRFTFNFSLDGELGQFDNKFDKNIYAEASVFLPSASLVLGRSSVAINATSRNIVDIRNIPWQVAKGMYNGFQTETSLWGEKIEADNLKVNQLSWLEVGASFGTFVYTFDEHVFTAGLSIKKLWGINGFAAKVDDWDYTTENQSTMHIDKFKGVVALASGFGSGKGYSGDLGVTYKSLEDTGIMLPVLNLNINYSNSQIYSSGLIYDIIEKQFWAIQKSGLDQATRYKELVASVDIILDSVKKNEKVYNDLTKYLFQYFEKYSLFNASEYIALKALSQKEVALNSALVNKLESYRKMKVGNRAPNFELLGDVFKNGTAVKAAIHLSEIKTKYKEMKKSNSKEAEEGLAPVPLLLLASSCAQTLLPRVMV